MVRLGVAGAACALWLAAFPARAEPFQTWVDLCLETNVDLDAVGAKAKAAGWTAIPAAEVGLDGSEIRAPAAYMNVDPATFGDKGPPADFQMLITGSGDGEDTFGIAGVRMDLCTVIAMNGDTEELQARMRDRLGIAPVNLDGETFWVFSRNGSRFRSESDLLDLDAADLPRIAREKKVYLGGLVPEDGAVGLVLAILRPD